VAGVAVWTPSGLPFFKMKGEGAQEGLATFSKFGNGFSASDQWPLASHCELALMSFDKQIG
jgi:hypothetical protein